MKKLIATIETDIGTMSLYFHGAKMPITAERGDVVEEIEIAKCEGATSALANAIATICAMYSGEWWGLKLDDGLIDELWS